MSGAGWRVAEGSFFAFCLSQSQCMQYDRRRIFLAAPVASGNRITLPVRVKVELQYSKPTGLGVLVSTE